MKLNWNKEKLEEFLKDKQRTIAVEEYLLLIDFINEIRPKVFIDIGTYLGASGFVLGTCCDSIQEIYSIENIDSKEYYQKDEATREEHGKFLPKEAKFLTNGYENNLSNLIKTGNEFVLWDAGKNTLKVMNQLKRSYDLKIKYIAFHDSGEIQGTVRKSILRAVRFKWYKILKEDIRNCPEKGITILELNQ